MEVKVQNASDIQSKFPQGSVLSIRYGTTRRQAPISSLHNHTLKFPDSRDGSNSLKIDVLQPVCKYVQTLAHDVESYRINLSGDEGTQVGCELNIKNEPKLKGQKQAPDPQVSTTCEKYQDAAKHARSYLEEHKLLQYFQQLLHTCIQEKPSDPKLFVWERIGSCLNGQMQDAVVAGCLADTRKQKQKMEEAESLRQALEEQLKEMDLRVQKLTASQVGHGSKELEELRQIKAEYEKEKERRQAQEKQLQTAEELRKELERTVEDLTKRVDTIRTSIAAEQVSASETPEIEKKASKVVRQLQDKADQLPEQSAAAKAAEEKGLRVAALAQTSSAVKQCEASAEKASSAETSAEKQISDATVKAQHLPADLTPLPPSALPANVPPPSSPPVPLPSSISAEEEELKGLVKQQIIEASKSGTLRNAFEGAAAQAQVGDSTQKALDDKCTPRTQVQKALEAAWDNGALEKALSAHAAQWKIEEVKRSMNRSLELAKQSGALGDALVKHHEELEKEKQALIEPIGIAMRDGQLVRAIDQSQKEADKKVMETKELLKNELLKASGTGALLNDLNAMNSLPEQSTLVNSN